MVRAPRSGRRRRPARLRRRGRDRGAGAGAGRGRHAVPRPGGRRRSRPRAGRGARATAAPAVVLDRTLLDIAVVPASGSAEGVAVDCAGMARGLLVAPATATPPAGSSTVAIADAAPGDRSHPRARRRSLSPSATPDTPIGDAVDRRRDRPQSGARPSRSPSPISSAPWKVCSTRPCEYAKERQQYGVAIGSFQAVQHLLAEARVLVEGSISLAQYAAWAVDALPPGEALEAGVGRRRPTAPAPRGPCVRPRSRCTAGSATPGSASCTCTFAARCCRARCSATRATTCVRWHAVDWEYDRGL